MGRDTKVIEDLVNKRVKEYKNCMEKIQELKYRLMIANALKDKGQDVNTRAIENDLYMLKLKVRELVG